MKNKLSLLEEISTDKIRTSRTEVIVIICIALFAVLTVWGLNAYNDSRSAEFIQLREMNQ